ncbi:MAG: S26 family signal peptidase [Candidatus Thermoplasmatota archaeon]|nr:S26 family signal peptidase [Candidatus Thermoplasmatota archaeon]MEE3134287.1 S26 family signal peptidase [Candidatus Thermoplasmatota archaeon]
MIFSKIWKFFTGKLRMITIEGDSMSPTIKNGEFKWVDYSKKALEMLKVGDIVLFKNPFGKNLIVKRIDNIDIEKGYWMKGDNKNILESTDSETFGYVKSQNLKGKVLI